MKRIWLILSLVLSTAGFAVDFGVRDTDNHWPDVVGSDLLKHRIKKGAELFRPGV